MGVCLDKSKGLFLVQRVAACTCDEVQHARLAPLQLEVGKVNHRMHKDSALDGPALDISDLGNELCCLASMQLLVGVLDSDGGRSTSEVKLQ